MSLDRWKEKLAADAPIAKEAADGHWRKLPVGQTGHDQAGTPIRGKTWVSRSRLKESFKPMEHQEDFSRAALKERDLHL
jgi:hypothetical protein